MVEEIPSEFTDDERWFRYFPKKAVVILAIGFCLAFGSAKVMDVFGLFMPTLIVIAIIAIVLAAMTMIPIPETNYLKGGGQSIMDVVIKIILRKFKKVLYALGYNDYKRELVNN